MAALLTIGVIFEICGLVLAFYGLHTRQADFGVPGQGAFYPAMAALRRFRERLQLQIGRLLRRRRDVTVSPGPIVVRATAFSPSVRIGYGSLPKGTPAALAELDRRAKDLLDRIQVVRDEQRAESDRINQEIEDVRSEVDAQVKRLEDLIRELATGDVALQYVGLSLIAIGLLLQFVASTFR